VYPPNHFREERPEVLHGVIAPARRVRDTLP
jgi:hypothetical protein